LDLGLYLGSDVYRIFGHAKKALIRERCMTGSKELYLSAVAHKPGTRQCPRKLFLTTQNMVLVSFFTTKCAISQ
jgi:hypothetical protein